MSLMVGASLIGLMVRTKLVLVLMPSWSVTVTVLVTFPLALGSGVMVMVRLVPPVPATTARLMFALGTIAWLDEKAATVRPTAGVSGSLTVKVTGPMTVSSLMVRSAMAWSVGAALALFTVVVELLAALGSRPVVATCARLVRNPETSGRMAIATFTKAPAFTEPIVHRTMPPL